MQMNEITDKLKFILQKEGIKNAKDSDVAKMLNINPDTFYSMKFRNSIPYKQILHFLNERNININAFFYEDSLESNTPTLDLNYNVLKYYDVNASMGGGALNDNVSFSEVIIDEKLSDFFGSKDCDIIPCIGDSMEPEIKDDSLCLVDKSKSFKEGGVFAVNTRDGLFIKQIFKSNKGGVYLHSFNLSYADVHYQNGDFLIVGKVVGTISRI
ncbi:S24 family peptidase [Campylobacter lari]|uniref:S24 family peptidase n=1 Tax=Campylobacter lari TaxID=201 RepID=A0A5N7GEB9_CAMLA|nr:MULTISPECIES: LexA family transcriptional regulator [Campylobacter]AJC89233.1 peptidase S24 LexA-like protein [Campylobacter lari subsp. concheus LMG 11760]EAC1839477.1 S24 family peptidase [Campylobacter lari]EAH7031425.1 S24 family peptidase [Campylobacter lari]EAH7581067.1 S24 family peptidase [Campylobacter lari]EAH7584818.1 S24 family peptidase [Campylobacter lari]